MGNPGASLYPFFGQPNVNSSPIPSYAAYISPDGYANIQELLPYSHVLKEPGLSAICTVPSYNPEFLTPPLQALGPKTKQGLIDWFMKYMITYEGLTQYLYLDTVGKITTGRGLNLSDVLSVRYKNMNGAWKKVDKFKAHLFLNDPNYQTAIMQKVLTILHACYFNKALNIQKLKKKDKHYDPTIDHGHLVDKATEQQIFDNLYDLATRIEEHKYGQKYGAGCSLEKGSILITVEEADQHAREFLWGEIDGLVKVLPSFYSFPAGAQLAIIDMGYNTNYDAWHGKKHELYTFYQEVHNQWVDWHNVAYGAKNPASCPASVAASIDPETRFRECGGYSFWRKTLDPKDKYKVPHPSDRNIATQILLILADEWEKQLSYCPRPPTVPAF